MRRLIYSMTVSLDGFIAGPGGDISWTAPDPELHRFHNDQVREIGVHLCGRRLYETMVPWETDQQLRTRDPVSVEFAGIWEAIPKVVFSRTLERVEGNARLARGDVLGELADVMGEPGEPGEPGEGDVGVGGAGLAGQFAQADLIDEYRLFVSPVVVGAGTPYFPPLERQLDLQLIETRTFSSRVVYLRYGRAAAASGA